MEFLTRIIPTPEVAARIVDVYDHAQWVLVTVSVALAAAGFAGLNLVWKIKESIYDKEEYQKVVRELQDIEPGLEVFRPWKVLSRVEGWFIGVCVLSATMQVTVGFLDRWWSSLTCFAVAGLMLIGFVFVVRLHLSNNRSIARLSEKVAQGKMQGWRPAANPR
jgi:hypothetical protein